MSRKPHTYTTSDRMKRWPVLPLRGLVPLPDTTIFTQVGRAPSIAAVEEALTSHGKLFAIAQKDIAVDEPGPTDVFCVGTLARVISHEAQGDGTLRIELKSLRRAEAISIEEGTCCWWAALRFEPGSRNGADLTRAALERLMPVLRKYVRSERSRPKQRQLWRDILGIEDPARLADILGDRFFSNAINWDLDIRPRQAFLEIFTLHERLDYLCGFLQDQLAQARAWRAEEKRKELDGALNEPPVRTWHKVDDLLIWKHRIRNVQHAILAPSTTRPNPLVLDDIVVVSVFSPGMIYAIDRVSGEKCWSRHVGKLGHSSVCSAGELLYGGTSQTIFALDRFTGEIQWRYCPYGTESEYIYSSPVVSDGRLYLGDRAGRLHCLDAASGKLLWRKQTSRAENNDVNATGIVHKGLVITATNAGFAAAYECQTGERVWKQSLDGGSIHEFQSHLGGFLVNTCRSIYLLDMKDGRVRERWNWPRRKIQGFCAAGDTLLIATEIPWHPRPFQSMKEAMNRPDTALLHGLRNNRLVFERPGSRFEHGAALAPGDAACLRVPHRRVRDHRAAHWGTPARLSSATTALERRLGRRQGPNALFVFGRGNRLRASAS